VTYCSQSFNEKLLYKMVWDRRPLLVTLADKVAVRDYIAERIGPGYTTDIYAITEDLATIRREDLPRNFVVKNSHLSGGVVVVFDGADPNAKLPDPADVYARTAVCPDRVDWEQLLEVSEAWLSTSYTTDLCGEWMYDEVPRRVVVEELITSPTGALPDDLRFFVMNGRCRMIRAACGVVGATKTVDDFWPGWIPIDASFIDGVPVPQSSRALPPPARLAEMTSLAETLAAETDFLRVDMFMLDDRIVVGELTNFPSAANGRWDPPGLDDVLGEFWAVPRRYRRPR
jgi:hypothetical protein